MPMLKRLPQKAFLWLVSEAFRAEERMAQFDLYLLKGGQLVVDLQTDLIEINAIRDRISFAFEP